MIPLPILLELCEYACSAGGRQDYRPATAASIDRICGELGVSIPSALIAVSRECPSYGNWFAGLGEDYDQWRHILRRNADIRLPAEGEGGLPLPDHLVILNLGYDADCICWDRSRVHDGEHPIVGLSLDGTEVEPEYRHATFIEYLMAFCSAPRTWSRSLEVRRRVRAIFDEYPALGFVPPRRRGERDPDGEDDWA